MIRKAQIKFITIVMCILLAVFGLLYGVMFNIGLHFNEQTIEQTLKDTASSYLINPNGHIHSKSIIAVVVEDINHNKSVKSLSFDSETFTLEQANYLINVAISKAYYSGKISNVYYTTFDINGIHLFVATDATEMVTAFRTKDFETRISLLITYGVLLVIVVALSKSIFKPLHDAFNKQKQFISNASHELKTPLSIISANADVLKAESDNKWVNNIKSQTERMNDLVQDMLSLAKIDEDKIKLTREKFCVSDEVNEVALSFDAVAFEKNKNLQLFVQPNIHHVGDKQSVKKILSILLDNAVKHADENGQIIVELKKQNGKTILSVFNSGSNIPAENANKIFERFYRGDQSRSRQSGGSGLGLSIAKSIADANKWKIFATSVPNQSMMITLVI